MKGIRNQDITAEFNVYSSKEKTQEYRGSWAEDIDRMEKRRGPKQIRIYNQKGKRDVGRPCKR